MPAAFIQNTQKILENKIKEEQIKKREEEEKAKGFAQDADPPADESSDSDEDHDGDSEEETDEQHNARMLRMYEQNRTLDEFINIDSDKWNGRRKKQNETN